MKKILCESFKQAVDSTSPIIKQDLIYKIMFSNWISFRNPMIINCFSTMQIFWCVWGLKWYVWKTFFLCWPSSGSHLFDPIYGLYFSHQHTLQITIFHMLNLCGQLVSNIVDPLQRVIITITAMNCWEIPDCSTNSATQLP